MENQNERLEGAVADRHVDGAEAVEFEFEGLDDIEPDHAKSAVEVLAAGGRRGEFLGVEDVGRKQLQRHWLHPRGEDIWSPEKIARIQATFLAEGQLAPLQAVMDEDGGGNYHVFIDGGLLHAVEALGYDGKLRVEVWHLNGAQVAAAIFRAETLNQKLSSYERSVVLRAYVDAHEGVQRACFEALGFESEAGLSRALAPVRLHPEILNAIADKTGIGVADSAKVVTLCGDPQKRDLILAWVDANPLAARTMKAGRLLKTLIERVEPNPKPELTEVGEDSWVYCSRAKGAPILARLLRCDGAFQLTVPEIKSLGAPDWSRLRAGITELG